MYIVQCFVMLVFLLFGYSGISYAKPSIVGTNSTTTLNLGTKGSGKTSPPYYPPLISGDWQTIAPSTVNWDVNKLNDAATFADANNSTALLVLYKGKILYEKYWDGWDAQTDARIYSVTKGMVDILIGIAQRQGLLKITDRVSLYLGQGWTQTSSENEAKITIENLMAMTSGLTSTLEYAAEPGQVWLYNSEAYYKLFDVIERASGLTRVQFTQSYLFDMIGMSESNYPEGNLSYRISASARDMARFGLLILRKGIWGQGSIVDQSYLSLSLSSSQNLNPSFGYLWWLNGKEFFLHPDDGRTVMGSLFPHGPSDTVAALGYGDKLIIVIPSKDLVIVRHGEPAGLNTAGSWFGDTLLQKVLSAAP